jgi:3-oxoacyl-[acyl-carrier-protein] synthase-3
MLVQIKTQTEATKGWKEFTPEEWLQKSIFSFKQDTKLLGREIVPTGTKYLKEILDKRGFDVTTIDYFLATLIIRIFQSKNR